MSSSTVLFELYIYDNNHEKQKINDLVISLQDKIIDIKKKILHKLHSNNKYNYIDLENITERVYKDFGKLFFDKGMLPRTIDNYSLKEFTTENRTFQFIIYPQTIPLLNDSASKLKKTSSEGFLQKILKQERKVASNQFQFYEDEFPPLK